MASRSTTDVLLVLQLMDSLQYTAEMLRLSTGLVMLLQWSNRQTVTTPPVIPVPDTTYNVFGGTLSLTHSTLLAFMTCSKIICRVSMKHKSDNCSTVHQHLQH